MSTMALEVKNLESWYGESHILHGVNFAVRDGEVVTLLGRNGAGRSTILKTILGLTSKRTGSIEVYGTQTIAMPTYKIARLGVGFCPEERGIFASHGTGPRITDPDQQSTCCDRGRPTTARGAASPKDSDPCYVFPIVSKGACDP